ncbi:MAG: methyltransferase domain-containing protein [Egibacteraceae bacterium]
MSAHDASVEVDLRRVEELLRGLAEDLAASGALRSPQWRQAFERTPRHVFVPRFYRRTPSGRELVDGARREQREAWLSAVYSNDALVTQYDNANPVQATSSSTELSLMALMLEALDVHDGHRVLEIGAGTGYNAALLCQRLGSELVTTIDIDAHLVEMASRRLKGIGHTPTVAVADGAGGFPANAPYDRVLATCSVAHIPAAWLTQTSPGGLILANLLPGFGGGLVRLEVRPDHSASGRFLPDPAYFMRMRGTRATQPPLSELIALTNGEGAVRPAVLQGDLGEDSLWFLAGLVMPHVVRFGSPGTQSIFDLPRLVDLEDRSWARIDRTSDGHSVTQGGPRNLWDELESTRHQWLAIEQPNRERYGLTVTATGDQYVWLDRFDSGHLWTLGTKS